MNKLLYSSYILFVLGFVLKFFHVPFNAILMLLGLGGVLIVMGRWLFRWDERFRLSIHMAIFSWMALLFITVKFLNYQFPALIFAILMSALGTVVALKTGKKLYLIPLLGLAILTLALYRLTTDRRFELLNIRFNYGLDHDYPTWDKYSWFLYLNGEKEEALKASHKAVVIAREYADTEWVEFIEAHEQAILKDNWTHYRDSH